MKVLLPPSLFLSPPSLLPPLPTCLRGRQCITCICAADVHFDLCVGEEEGGSGCVCACACLGGGWEGWVGVGVGVFSVCGVGGGGACVRPWLGVEYALVYTNRVYRLLF